MAATVPDALRIWTLLLLVSVVLFLPKRQPMAPASSVAAVPQLSGLVVVVQLLLAVVQLRLPWGSFRVSFAAVIEVCNGSQVPQKRPPRGRLLPSPLETSCCN